MLILPIDIANGSGWTPGWAPVLDRLKDPRCDVYSLGLAVLEMIHDGEDPLRIGGTLPIEHRGQ